MEIPAVIYVCLYALAAALYLGFHLGVGTPAARAGRWVMAAGWLIQLCDIGLRCFRMQHPLSSLAEAMAFIAWLLAGAFVLATFRHRLHAAGALTAPVVLVLLLLARVGPVEQSSPAAPLGSPLATLHIFLATVGIATFALAAVVAGLYLMQERRLKHKRLDLAHRAESAPLDTLDRLAARCVSFGFPVFTLTIITGAIWVAKLGLLRTGAAVRPEYLLTVVAWLVLGILLFARVGGGWRGRRAAWLTVGGFSAAALVLVGYFIRHIA
jgi:ABC-type uncharacterized transport system permease subunit